MQTSTLENAKLSQFQIDQMCNALKELGWRPIHVDEDGINPIDYKPEQHAEDEKLDLIVQNYGRLGNYYVPVEPTPAELARESIPHQIMHSDAICRKYVMNAKFLAMMKEGSIEDMRKNCPPREAINITALGNAALLRHHHPDKKYFKAMHEFLCRRFDDNYDANLKRKK